MINPTESKPAGKHHGSQWPSITQNPEKRYFDILENAVLISFSPNRLLSVLEAVEEWTEVKSELLTTLNEHEVMHEGQLIRHLYGLGYSIPEPVK